MIHWLLTTQCSSARQRREQLQSDNVVWQAVCLQTVIYLLYLRNHSTKVHVLLVHKYITCILITKYSANLHALQKKKVAKLKQESVKHMQRESVVSLFLTSWFMLFIHRKSLSFYSVKRLAVSQCVQK